jgi:hypothetical protein
LVASTIGCSCPKSGQLSVTSAASTTWCSLTTA